MAGTPEFWARELRTRAGQNGRLPVGLDEIVRWSGVHLDEVPLESCLGVCMRCGGNVGILIAEGQERGQRRFTIGHELGHFAIPTHEQSGHHCFERDLNAPDAKATEQEANEFAAELLMPRQAFAAELRGRGLPSIALAQSLAAPERFDVSLTSCARRLVELSPEPSALLCFEGGRLLWQVRSKGFQYRIPSRGSAPPPGSAAADACEGTACVQPVSVADVGWLAEAWDCDDLVESALAMPRFNQALSILTVIRER